VAPELFKREGGVAQLANIQDILKIVFAVPRKQLLGDLQATADWAKIRPGMAKSKVGVTGWCWGGGATIQAAAAIPDVKAAVAWYGPPARPFPDQPNPVNGFDVAKDVKGPFLGLFGEKDQGPKPEDAVKFGEMVKAAGNKDVEIIVYPGVGHGFHADYRPSYDAAAAADGWERCTDHFTKHLKA
jgi:carboxymethylenebutenolidase